MTNAAQRKPLLEAIESQRGCKAILYVTGDRPGLEAWISQDVIDLFVDHLDAIAPVPKISLVLYTNGGDTSAAWNLVNLIRMFCDKFEVIVPGKCRSAGTLVCLGADKIVMTKQATLGPVDPSIIDPLGPQMPGTKGEAPIPVSVEAIKGYLGEVKKYGQNEAAAQALLDLADKVHPLVLGQAFRSRKQIRELARRLLKNSLYGDENMEKIVEFLCSESGSHDYTINRREAGELGLRVEQCSTELYTVLKAIIESYSKQMELRSTYLASEQFLPIVEQLTVDRPMNAEEYEYTQAIVESVAHLPHAYISKGVIEIAQSEGEVVLHEHRQFEGWKEVANEI